MNYLRLTTLTIASALTFLMSSEVASQTSIPPCPAPFSKLVSNEVFGHYAVRVTERSAKPAQPNVKTGKAHIYRTVIREEAKQGPNFADHFTIIRIGCGAATTCIAITDAKSGNVYFPRELNSVEALLVDTGKLSVDALNYRRGSRLLVVIGSPNERREKAGIGYFIWQSGRLKLLRFTPAAELCGLPASTRF